MCKAAAMLTVTSAPASNNALTCDRAHSPAAGSPGSPNKACSCGVPACASVTSTATAPCSSKASDKVSTLAASTVRVTESQGILRERSEA